MLLVTFFINLLALISAVYVILILNRYVGYGLDSTLFTLTTGAILVVVFEFAFRMARMRLARGLAAPRDLQTADKTFESLLAARTEALDHLPIGLKREVMGSLASIQQAYNPPNLVALMDVPFVIVFLVALYLLSPLLALLATLFLAFMVGLVVFSNRRQPEIQERLTGESAHAGALIGNALDTDTVRAFNTAGILQGFWRQRQSALGGLRNKTALMQGRIQSMSRSMQSLMTIVIIGTGAFLVVSGELHVGAMIGANILATRAMQPLTRIAGLSNTLAKADLSMRQLKDILTLAQEPATGISPASCQGRIEFRDVGFAFPGSTGPLIESLTTEISSGSIVAVCGANGTGKTTFARLIVGLLQPGRGQIFVDGVELRQLAPDWWRRQIVYLPQEPTFFQGTARQNITALNPEMTDEDVQKVVEQAGLRQFFDERPQGLDLHLSGNGARLALGIRRRMALARALASQQAVGLFDEPFAGLDAEGGKAVNQVINQMVKQGKTVFIFTHDASGIDGANYVIDLNSKPKPTVREISS